MNDRNTNEAAGFEQRTGIEIHGAGKAWERPAVARLRAGGAENTENDGIDTIDKFS